MQDGHQLSIFKTTQHYSNYQEKKRVIFILTYFLLLNVCTNVFYDGDLIKVLLKVTNDDALTKYQQLSYYYLFIIDSLKLVTNQKARKLDIVLYFQEVIFNDWLISGLDLTDVLGS